MQETLRLIGELRRGLDILERRLCAKEPLHSETVPGGGRTTFSAAHSGAEYDPCCARCPKWRDGICQNAEDSCPLCGRRR